MYTLRPSFVSGAGLELLALRAVAEDEGILVWEAAGCDRGILTCDKPEGAAADDEGTPVWDEEAAVCDGGALTCDEPEGAAADEGALV